jgi:hypothetical protein
MQIVKLIFVGFALFSVPPVDAPVSATSASATQCDIVVTFVKSQAARTKRGIIFLERGEVDLYPLRELNPLRFDGWFLKNGIPAPSPPAYLVKKADLDRRDFTLSKCPLIADRLTSAIRRTGISFQNSSLRNLPKNRYGPIKVILTTTSPIISDDGKAAIFFGTEDFAKSRAIYAYYVVQLPSIGWSISSRQLIAIT